MTNMNRTALTLGLATLLALPVAFAGCADGSMPASATVEESAIPVNHTLPLDADGPTPVLTPEEIDGILLMREEEKLARDVYLMLSDIWNTNTFKNISQSEQTHMDEVMLLIDKYGLTDPVGDSEVGVFENADLQQLYDDLVARGSQSEVEALKVGAAIEEIDILDLEELLAQTDNADIEQVYGDLVVGSMKHLSSFTSVLAKRGVAYEPTYLTPEAYEEILNSEFSRGDK